MKLDPQLISSILQAIAAMIQSLGRVKTELSSDAQFQIEQAIAGHMKNLSDSIDQIVATEIKQQLK